MAQGQQIRDHERLEGAEGQGEHLSPWIVGILYQMYF